MSQKKSINGNFVKVQALYDKNLKLLSKKVYKKIIPLPNNNFAAYSFEKEADILDSHGNILYVVPSSICINKLRLTDKFLISKNDVLINNISTDKYGLYDFKKSAYVFDNFDYINLFNDFIIGLNNGLFIMYDHKYNKIFEFKIDYVLDSKSYKLPFKFIANKFIIVNGKSKDILVNSQGKLIAKYDKILLNTNKMSNTYSNYTFLALDGEKAGCINEKNEIIIPFVYDDIISVRNCTNSNDSYIAVQKDGKWTIKTTDNKSVNDFICDYTPLKLYKKYSVVEVEKRKFKFK